MSKPSDLPPEVVAARRTLSERKKPITTSSESGETIPVHSPIGDEVEALLKEMLSADQIDIVGIMPWECSERLIELDAERADSAGSPRKPTLVRYFTPSRERVAAYRHGGILGTVVQRWIAGITGLRNWLMKGKNGSVRRDTLSIFEFDDIFLDCVVCIRHNGIDSVTVLSRLPMTRVVKNDRPHEATAKLIVTHPANEHSLRDYLDRLAAESKPVLPRQLRCSTEVRMSEQRSEGAEFQPRISRLSDYGQLLPDDTEPIAIVAVYARTATGPAVLLKLRTKENSRDDFGKLSLISERVLEEDFPGGPLDPDPVRALDELWVRQGQPEPFEIPEPVFRNAAQRELFMSCGIDVAADRLKLCGTCLVEHENGTTYLGFYVYRLDLIRTEQNDELTRAAAWNPHLQIVPVAKLYQNPLRSNLNRLLTRREQWLLSVVLASAPETSR